MPEWFRQHETLMFWLGAASLVLFVGSLLLVPAIIVRIPDDYFASTRRPQDKWGQRHRALDIVLHVAKNIAGVIFILMGIAMLVLPGQGLLTIFIGFLLLEFPGKFRMERWLVSRPGVLSAINWYRKKRGRPALKVDGLVTKAAPASGQV